jgi:membrane associated rhomboid family serine protease
MSVQWESSPATTACPLGDICGFGGIAPGQTPNRQRRVSDCSRYATAHSRATTEWFRFILPIFLHVGIIHLVLVAVAICLAAAVVERDMGDLSGYSGVVRKV